MNWLQLAVLALALLVLACNCLTLWYLRRTAAAIEVRRKYAAEGGYVVVCGRDMPA